MEETFGISASVCIESAALAVSHCLKRTYRVVYLYQLKPQRCTANLLLAVSSPMVNISSHNNYDTHTKFQGMHKFHYFEDNR